MITLLLNWIKEPKNAIITGLGVLIVFLSIYNRYLSYESNKQETTINSLNKQVFNLKSNIELQNNAIKKLNEDFESKKKDFEKEYNNLQINNKPKLENIKKQESYISPKEVITTNDELEESRKLIKEFIKNRGIK